MNKPTFQQAVLLTIGEELLVGDTINTNAAWIGERLTLAGLKVAAALTVPDEENPIVEAFERYLQPGNLVVSTGGLGPTHDDITKKTIQRYFGVSLKRDAISLERNQRYFAQRGIPFSESNYGQSDVPENADVLQNLVGTAQGMWVEHNGAVLVILPGVPREMKHLMDEQVMPRILAEKRIDKATAVFYLKTMGIGESNLSDLVIPAAASFLNEQVSLAFLPQSLGVNLRIIGRAETKERAEQVCQPLLSYIKQHAAAFIYSDARETTPIEALGKLLVDKNLTIGFAESCTGGLFSAWNTDIAGSSAWFKGAIVAYANEAKTALLGVPQETISNSGAVSKETAIAMVNGLMDRLKPSVGVAVTGIAGPSGGSEEKPVGLVWVALSGPFGKFVFRVVFGRDRKTNRERTVFISTEVVRRLLIGIPEMPQGVVLETF